MSGLLGGQMGSKRTSGGQGAGEGRNAARASGSRGPGRQESTSTEKTGKLPSNWIDSSGQMIGELPLDGDAPIGEALTKVQRALKAVNADSSAVESQSIPREHRKLVLRFQEAVMRGGEQKASDGNGESGNRATDGDDKSESKDED